MDPFEMLSDGNSNSFRRAEQAFEPHQRAVAFRAHVRPASVEELPMVIATGPWVLLHPAFSREVANTSLLAMAGICDHLARRLSPGLFEPN